MFLFKIAFFCLICLYFVWYLKTFQLHRKLQSFEEFQLEKFLLKILNKKMKFIYLVLYFSLAYFVNESQSGGPAVSGCGSIVAGISGYVRTAKRNLVPDEAMLRRMISFGGPNTSNIVNDFLMSYSMRINDEIRELCRSIASRFDLDFNTLHGTYFFKVSAGGSYDCVYSSIGEVESVGRREYGRLQQTYG